MDRFLTRDSSRWSDTISSSAEPTGRTADESLTGRSAVSAAAVVRLLRQLQQDLLVVPVARHVGMSKSGFSPGKKINHTSQLRVAIACRTNSHGEGTKVELAK